MVEFFIEPLLQMLKANDFDRDGWRTFTVQFPCQKMKSFLFSRIISEKNASSKTFRWGILYLFSCSGLVDPQTFAQTIFLIGFNPCIDNISYLLKPLNKKPLLRNFYISALAFSLNQIQHKPSFLLVLIPAQTIFPTCFSPKTGNLRYFCNFSSFSFQSIPVKIISRYMTTNFCSLFM